MNKTAWGSIIIGAVVFVISMILPYLGDKNFLWFTISGSAFTRSGTLYVVSPAAMPLVLILWLMAIYGLLSGYLSRKIGVASDCYTKVGTAIGIINVLLLGWLTLLWPFITWLVTGRPTSLV